MDLHPYDTVHHDTTHHDMGMLGSMNDAKVIHLSLIYLKLTWGNLFNDRNFHDGIKPSMIKKQRLSIASAVNGTT
jgi:hypothetical protein